MAIDLPDEINVDKNRLDSIAAWLWLLDVTIPDVEEVFRFINNPEDIVYNGNTYTKCNFTIGSQENISAKLPQCTLNITNADLAAYLSPYIDNYDGIVGATIIITPVNSEHLDVDMSPKAREYMVIQSLSTEEQITLILGAPSPLLQKFPLQHYFGLRCRFVGQFKGIECGYSDEETVCDGTLKRCKELNNETRNGGFPGIRSKTVRFA